MRGPDATPSKMHYSELYLLDHVGLSSDLLIMDMDTGQGTLLKISKSRDVDKILIHVNQRMVIKY